MSVRVDEGLTELRRSLAGTVIGPADAEYDAARRCFNALVDRRPAVIARCAGAGTWRPRSISHARTSWRWPCAEAGTTPPATASVTAGS